MTDEPLDPLRFVHTELRPGARNWSFVIRRGFALRLTDRLGGHLVSGHVDGCGAVLRFEPVGESWLLEIRCAAGLAMSSAEPHLEQSR